MKIKLELNTKKTAKAAVAIAAKYGLCRVSKGTKSNQLLLPTPSPSLSSW